MISSATSSAQQSWAARFAEALSAPVSWIEPHEQGRHICLSRSSRSCALSTPSTTASAASRCTSSIVLGGILLFSTLSRLVFGVPVNWALEMSQFVLSAYYLLGGAYALQQGRACPNGPAYTALFAEEPRDHRRPHHRLRDLLSGRSVCRRRLRAPTTRSSTNRQNYSAWAPVLWPIKVVMTVGVFLMLLQAISTFFKDIAEVRGKPIA